MLLKAGQFEFRFPRSTLLMGILNVTPDSFSDGGRHLEAGRAVEHGLRMIEEGADILDIGGESTRPGAMDVPEEEERRRVLPVIEALQRQVKVPISIDTRKPGVAEAALAAGASLINDVAAHRVEDRMWRLVASTGAGYVAMHMQGEPGSMQIAPHYADVLEEVDRFFGDRLDRMGACGVRLEQVIFDPGIGFGKTRDHNLQLIGNLKRFHHWGRPLLLGVSRKSVVGEVTGSKNPEDRLPGSLAGAVWAQIQGVQVVRAHDVAATRQALKMAEAVQSRQRQ